jgi:hypothetical protein
MKQAVQDAGFRDINVFFSKKNQYRYVTIAKK